MHPNPIFRGEDARRSLAFAAERGFGILMTNGETLPLVAHVPFVLDVAGHSALLHLMRSNPLARACRRPLGARIAVSGPDSYVSPDWYRLDDQVPTWNYVAVHLEGTLEPLPAEELRSLLDALSASFEARLLPKPPWDAAKMTPEVLERMMRIIQPFRFRVEDVQGTWKLGQNKPPKARQGAAQELRRAGLGQETAGLAELMDPGRETESTR